MAAKVSFKITTDEKFKSPQSGEYTGDNGNQFSPAYCPGQITFVENVGKIYLDFHGYRKCYTPIGSNHNGLNYLGISTTDPTTGTVTINGNEIIPSEKDMVVFGKKEYLYRKGEDGVLGWFELGNEDSPEWQNDLEWGDETGSSTDSGLVG